MLSPVITGPQIRAARALVGFTQKVLAKKSGVSEISIKNIERGVTDARGSTLEAIKVALEKAGVLFLDAGDIRDGGRGIRMRR
jgi:predicted transcriptional regulator